MRDNYKKFEIIISAPVTGKPLSVHKLSTEEIVKKFVGESIPAELFTAEPGEEVVFYHQKTEVTAIRLK